MTMYDKFLERLKEIREYEWNATDIKIWGEINNQKGVREGETALEAIARHMTEVRDEEMESLRSVIEFHENMAWEKGTYD